MSEECNGWTNYATWRVNMEILRDINFDKHVTVDELKEIVEDCVFKNPETRDTPILVEDYARAFIAEVNFHEIARDINEELKLLNSMNCYKQIFVNK